ncbi:hypothetical protein GCM10010404_58260 [Nonomuraea africana]
MLVGNQAARAPQGGVLQRAIAAGRTDVGSAVWPSAPIRTERLVLRESQARDRVAFVELFDSSEAGAYVGGARPREESR